MNIESGFMATTSEALVKGVFTKYGVYHVVTSLSFIASSMTTSPLDIPPPPGFLLTFLGGFFVVTSCALVFLDLAHTAIGMRAIVYYILIASGSLARLLHVDWSATVVLIIHVMMVFIVQSFYVRRVWYYTGRSSIKALVPALLVFCRTGASSELIMKTRAVPSNADIRSAFFAGIGVYLLTGRLWSEFHTNNYINIIVNVANSIALFTNAYFAVVMLYYMQHEQIRRLQTERINDGILRWTMNYVINSGLLAFLLSICTTITFITVKTNPLYAAFMPLEGKLSAISFFGLLNARVFLSSPAQRSSHNPTGEAMELSPMQIQFARRRALPVAEARTVQHHVEILQDTIDITQSDQPETCRHDGDRDSNKKIYPVEEERLSCD
ncbi:hypothetical protein K474DRAFT_1673674 [Panus rudis PR-1116 ss-1]|nr:hypothetical protein K474DRAFT_1673674 [Panus rudis PR-1116 ss-1]